MATHPANSAEAVQTEAERRAQLIKEMRQKILVIDATVARTGVRSMEDAILKREFQKRLARLESGGGLEAPSL